MKLYIRLSQDRGHADHGWLNSHHTFSFAGYHDPAHVHFGPLRVINDDTVAGGGGFPSHPHDNMEILTYVTEGALAHKDSIGTGSVIKAGDVQIISGGTGIVHSEFNASETDTVKFMQIWIFPNEKNFPPRYEQKTPPRQSGLTDIAIPGGSLTAVDVKQDISVYRWLGEGSIDAPFTKGLYIHVIDGHIDVGGLTLGEGDGAGLYEPADYIKALKDNTHALLFAF